MDGKIKSYADNEKSLLDSVKTTVITAFQKTEKMKAEFDTKILEYEEKLKALQNEFDIYRNNTEVNNEGYKKKIEQLVSKNDFQAK
jgi:hypothetical protein